jgi:hypothetical protein
MRTAALAAVQATRDKVHEMGIGVGGIHQHIGVDDEHYRPSIAWYRASRSAMSTIVPPLRNVDAS